MIGNLKSEIESTFFHDFDDQDFVYTWIFVLFVFSLIFIMNCGSHNHGTLRPTVESK